MAYQSLPGPWAELEVPGEIILSVPSSAIRNLDRPTELMKLHERVMKAAGKFGGIGPRTRTERFVLDKQTGYGKRQEQFGVVLLLLEIRVPF